MSATTACIGGIPHRGRRSLARKRVPIAGPLAVALAVAVTIGAAGALPNLLDRAAQGASSPAASLTIHVRPTDTLWSIARANRLPGATVAQTVDEIRRVNGLASAAIAPGSTLHVPGAVVGPAAYAAAGDSAAVR